ncbi:hypothetical protein [Desulfosporosinus youngiae]|uniref:Uncharacterized protein n=1 Tax=Desulfosporosinus youngiae DSM 17734 TaxID=768710 RepID=H5XZY3_9FIRM|nr:hypothetical protein [Desulfosporosinus youngiae]EHQ92179.1 hypothetical protein DesyoDRAFT_5250 [Desulfosporosinus youngiae DSM 17734]
MSTCHIDISPKDAENVTEVILKKYPDSIMCLAPINPKSTYSPSKGKKCFRITCEILVPPEAIEGESCLDDFGAMVLLRLPKKRIKADFLKENKSKEEVT